MLQWGTVPEAFAAVGTVGALLVAVLLLKREADRDESRDQEGRASQASRVAAWVDLVRGEGPFAHGSGITMRMCILLNSSPLPVSDVHVSYLALGEGSRTRRLGPGNRLVILPPGERTVEIRREVAQEWEAIKDTYPTLVAEVRFTDAAGRRWWRAWNGVLIDKGPYRPDTGAEDDDATARGTRSTPTP